jgi:hypothetical protein
MTSNTDNGFRILPRFACSIARQEKREVAGGGLSQTHKVTAVFPEIQNRNLKYNSDPHTPDSPPEQWIMESPYQWLVLKYCVLVCE